MKNIIMVGKKGSVNSFLYMYCRVLIAYNKITGTRRPTWFIM